MTGMLIPGETPLGWAPPGPDLYPGEFAVTVLPDLPPEYLLEIGSAPPPVAVLRASLWQPGAAPVGGVPDDATVAAEAVVLRYSMRGWIGEPGDAMAPNVPYPRRLTAPPTLLRSIRVLPEDTARLNYQAGEVVLDNADGALDVVAGDWGLAGRPAVLRRAPHREPLRAAYSEFGRVGEFRITGAALAAGAQVRIGLRAAAADLEVPLSQPYAGIGGLEGAEALAGQMRPQLYGAMSNIAPVQLLPADLIWQVSARPLASVADVRDRGAALTPTADYATLAALQAASVATGRYATCLAQGLVRTGSPPSGQLTVDATASGAADQGAIAFALLTGPGGLAAERIVSSAFAALPAGLAGWLWTGGTVAAALDAVMTSCAGWWGSDRLGRITCGRLSLPDALGPRVTLERWMLQEEPAEEAGVPPRWRQRVQWRRLGVVQTATDLAGVVAADPAAVALYGTEAQVSTSYDPAIAAAYPSATDSEPLASGYQEQDGAQALADELLALHGVRRRRWRVQAGKWGHLVDLGDRVAVDHPKLSGRNWIAIAAEESGDAVTLTLWG